MIKLSGIIFVFFSIFYLGNSLKQQYKIKYQFADGIVSGLEFLTKELSFMTNILSDAFINSSEYSGIAESIFVNAGNVLKTNPSVDLGNYLYTEILPKDKTVADLMKSLGNQLGISDSENEIKTINNTLYKLKELVKEYEKDYKTKGELIGKISVIFGIGCGIILI